MESSIFAHYFHSQNITYEKFEKQSILKGHSTPEMAGHFAATVGAKQLILTHFSARFEKSTESDDIMNQICRMAASAAKRRAQLKTELQVSAAYDYLKIDLPVKDIPDTYS